jgi:hypothetical protein
MPLPSGCHAAPSKRAIRGRDWPPIAMKDPPATSSPL